MEDFKDDDGLRVLASKSQSQNEASGQDSSVTTLDYDEVIHKTILVGDSGVGKTSLLVNFDQGTFSPGAFAATVGIGFTIMLLGDSGVGKTCLSIRYRNEMFQHGIYMTTIGLDFWNKIVKLDDATVKLQIWDTAGQERFRSVTHAYYRDAHALLLLYDVTSRTSFDNTRAWLSEIHEYAQDEVVVMLIANKADMNEQRQIRREDGERLAREFGVAFMETSAKTGQNVELAFMAVSRELRDRLCRPNAKRFDIKEYIRQESKMVNEGQNSCCSGAS